MNHAHLSCTRLAKNKNQIIRIEINESNCLPCNGGGRSAKDSLEVVVFKMVCFTETCFKKIILSTIGILLFCAGSKSFNLKEMLFISQHGDLIMVFVEFFSGQQSLKGKNEI